MKKKLVAVLGVGAVLAVLASTAFAAVQVVFKAELKPAKAGKSAALDVQLASSEPGQPQPPIMNRIVIKFNKGGKYNTSKFPRCKLASLQAKGPNACPSGSKIGTGSGVGRALPVVEDPVNAKLTLFNGSKVGGKDAVFVYVFPDLGPDVRDRLQDLAEGAGQLRLHAGLLDPADQDAAERARRIGSHGKDQDGEEDGQEEREEVPADRGAEEVHRHVEERGAVLLRDRRDCDDQVLGEVLQVTGC